jgi:hypothetical protein
VVAHGECVAIVVGFLESAIRSTGMIIGGGRLPVDEKSCAASHELPIA